MNFMKTLTLLTFCLLGQLAFSQTKAETENWIKSKIEAGGLAGIQEFDINYEGEYLSIENKTYFSGLTVRMKYLVKVKCITNFYFKDYESSLHLVIKTSPTCKIQLNDYTNNTIERVNDAVLILDKSFADNNMKNRFSKALNNLIKFYGGSVKKEAY